MTAQEVIRLLDLKPLEMEGGYFRRSYEKMEDAVDGKPKATAIYYLLTPDTYSCLHRLPSDELYHFYLGDPVELLVIDDNGQGSPYVLGGDIARRERLQQLVPAGVWQGSRLLSGGKWALLGTTMTPGFTDDDFIAMPPEKVQELTNLRPDLAERIRFLSP